jgi:hypothetical protein
MKARVPTVVRALELSKLTFERDEYLKASTPIEARLLGNEMLFRPEL